MFYFLEMSLLGLLLCEFVNDFCYNMLKGIGLWGGGGGGDDDGQSEYLCFRILSLDDLSMYNYFTHALNDELQRQLINMTTHMHVYNNYTLITNKILTYINFLLFGFIFQNILCLIFF